MLKEVYQAKNDLLGWLVLGISTPIELFYIKEDLTVTVSKYIWYKNVFWQPLLNGGGVMVKALNYGIVWKRVRTPVAILRYLSDKYPWERYEPSYHPRYGLKSTTIVLLEGWICH